MSDNELLLAISDMMDTKLKPVNNQLEKMEDTLENNILPRLQTIEECYLSTYERYKSGIGQIQTMQDDVDVMKTTIERHSEILHKLA